MIPVLFDPSATAFNSNGIGPLIDSISCKVTEELNGPYELEMTYPMKGKYFSEIRYSSIIVAKPFQNGTPQAFRIYKISKPMKGNVQIYARHISYQLNHIPCSSFSGQSCAQVMANIITAVAEYCPFNFSTDITQNRTSVSANLLADLDTTGDSDAKAPEYVAGNTYTKDSYVKHNDKIYQALIDITDDRWIESHWENVTVPYVGFTNAAINGNTLVEDQNAVTVWVRCEKSKRYVLSKMLSHIFRVGTMTQIPSPGKLVQNVVSDPTVRKMEYTTSNDAEYLLFYLYQSTVDGGEEMLNSIITSASIRAIGTYSWMLYEPKCIRTFLLGEDDNSIQAIYGGEYEWNNYSVILHENRGSDKGVKIRYGKNLIDLTQEENIENTITGIYPIWKSDGTVVELPEKTVHSANAGNFPYLRTVIQDFSSEFDQMPTVEELREMANLYIQNENIGVPDVSLTVNFVNLSETEEYKNILALQTVNMGDLVTVDFPALEVNTKQKVSKTEYDVLNERYTSVTIGNIEKSIDTTLEDQMNALSQKVSEEEAQNKVDRATGVLNSGTRGHVIINRNDDGFANEIYFTDNQNVALAKQVLRINNSGIGFSSKGIRGPYYQAWTLDGHLSLGGVNNSHGTLTILDANGNMVGQWNNNGVLIKDGRIESTDIRSSNGAFQVIEEGEDEEGNPSVTIYLGGFSIEDENIRTRSLGWSSNDNVNPADQSSASAAINGGYEGGASSDGYAAFKKLWLDDSWYEGGTSMHGQSGDHLWDITEVLRWLDDRIYDLEQAGGGGGGGDTEGDDGENWTTDTEESSPSNSDHGEGPVDPTDPANNQGCNAADV